MDATKAVAAGSAEGSVCALISDWDQKRYPSSRDLVAFETRPAWSDPRAGSGSRSTPALAVAGRTRDAWNQPQTYTVEVEKAFFIDGFECTSQCDGDVGNPLRMRVPVKVTDFAAASAPSISTVAISRTGKSATPPAAPDYQPSCDRVLTLEDAGFAAQPPDREYAVTIPATLKAADGQTLGYTLAGHRRQLAHARVHEFRRRTWRVGEEGGAELPFYARNLLAFTQWPAPLTRRIDAAAAFGDARASVARLPAMASTGGLA